MSEGASTSNEPPRPIEMNLIIIRHAERVDETDTQSRQEFGRAVACKQVWYGDAWLSQNGFLQAAAMAEKVSRSLASREHLFSKVFVSPLQRTISTAEPLCKALDKPLAATKSLAFAKALMDHARENNDDISACFSQMALYKYDFQPKEGVVYEMEKALDQSWQKCIVRLARAEFEKNSSTGRANVLLVSHRELVHALANLASNAESFRPGYATATAFRISITAQDIICNIQLVLPPTDEVFDASFLDAGWEIGQDVNSVGVFCTRFGSRVVNDGRGV